jgi:hypothetical protein
MSRSDRRGVQRDRARAVLALGVAAAFGSPWLTTALAAGGNYPITEQQRGTANQVAQAGVPLADLAPNAPESHTVQRGDTLWDISKLFLKSPWRWPQLWGMNLDQIRNPHLIYPGQVLVLVKVDGRAMLKVAQDAEPGARQYRQAVAARARRSAAGRRHLVDPAAPDRALPERSGGLRHRRTGARAAHRRHAGKPRHRVARRDRVRARRPLRRARLPPVPPEPKPMVDPESRQVLGYEATYVGTAEFVRDGGLLPAADGKASVVVPSTFTITSTRLEAGVGDRLSPVPPSDLTAYAPHAPNGSVEGRIVSVYGEAVRAGQNQIVALNRGARDGMERGHVLALWRAGRQTVDRTDGQRTPMRLPDERHGLLFVFRVFDRVSYALILSVQEPVGVGDRFTQP